jgi:hypothetical protein
MFQLFLAHCQPILAFVVFLHLLHLEKSLLLVNIEVNLLMMLTLKTFSASNVSH